MLFGHLKGSRARTLGVILLASLAVVAALSLWLTFLAVPTRDDFCRGGWPKDALNFIAKVQAEYLYHSGRWAVHSIYAIAFPHIGMTTINYNLLLALSAPLWIAVFYIFIHILFRRSLGAKQKTMFAILLCAIYWVGMPGPGDTWFWLTGSVEYQLPFLLMSLSLLVLTSSWITGEALGPKIGAAVLGTVLAVLVTGLHEIVGLLLFGALAVGVLLAFSQRRWDVLAIYLFVLVVVVAGIAFNIRAPGGTIRAAEDFPNPNNPAFAIRALISPRTSPVAWLGDARLLCLTALLLTTPAFMKLRPSWTTWRLPLPGPFASMAVTVPLIVLGAVVGGSFAVAFAQGSDVPLRVQNLLYAALIVGWIATLIPLARLAGAEGEAPGPMLRAVNVGAAFLLPVTLLIAPNTLRGVSELPQLAREWRPMLDARDTLLSESAARGEKDVVVKSINMDPRTYRWDDIGPDPADWKNVCVARYYGVSTVRTDGPSPSSAVSDEER